MNEFKEEMIFNLEKDLPMCNSIKFREKMIKKYNLSNQEVTDLRAKLISYQLEKYGDTLSNKYTKPTMIEHKRETRRRNSKRKKVFYEI
jgi:hypothetical protein